MSTAWRTVLAVLLGVNVAVLAAKVGVGDWWGALSQACFVGLFALWWLAREGQVSAEREVERLEQDRAAVIRLAHAIYRAAHPNSPEPTVGRSVGGPPGS